MHHPYSENDHRLTYAGGLYRQARQELNPQPVVLETTTLPIELLAYMDLRFEIYDLRGIIKHDAFS